MTIRAVIYSRVSTDEQGDNFSLPTQVDACQRYAIQHGMDVVAQCQDIMSGALLDRPGLTKVRQIIAAGGCDALIIYSQDRLTRSVAHMLLIRDELRSGGVAMHAVSRGQSQDTPEGRLFDTIEASFAEYERLKIKERLTRGKRGKLESGRVIGQGCVPPYGFHWEGTKRERHLVLNPDEAAIVCQIAAWYLAGVGVREICRRLDTAGVLTSASTRAVSERHLTGGDRRRDGWAKSAIYAMLRSRTYMGEHISHAYHIAVPIPAILDTTTWNAVQARLAVGRQRARRNAKRCYLLRTRLVCACGGSLVGTVTREGTHEYRYYRCHTKQGLGLRTCDATPSLWTANMLESIVWNWLTTDVLDEQRILEGISQQHDDAAGQRATLEAERATYQYQVDVAAAKVAKMIQLFSADVLTLAEVAEHKRAIDATKDAALAEIARVDAALQQSGPGTANVDAVLAYVAELRETLAGEVSDDLRARIIELLDVRGALVDDEDVWSVDVTAHLTLDQARLAIVSSPSYGVVYAEYDHHALRILLS